MKEFLTYNTVRDNGLILARKMYDEGYVPDVIYASMRGGAYLANVISEKSNAISFVLIFFTFKILFINTPIVLFVQRV